LVLFTRVLHANIGTGCYKIQNVECSDALVYTNDVLQCVCDIPLPVRQKNDVEENLGPVSFNVIDSTST